MLQLLKTYSAGEIMLFIVFLAIAIKECVTFIDWVKGVLNGTITKRVSQRERDARIDKTMEGYDTILKVITNTQARQNDEMEEIKILLNMLIASDKDDIKSSITREYHYFCEEKCWIDDYSLDCLEKRYKRYQDEGGNSFIADLMAEIRKLPKHPPM